MWKWKSLPLICIFVIFFLILYNFCCSNLVCPRYFIFAFSWPLPIEYLSQFFWVNLSLMCPKYICFVCWFCILLPLKWQKSPLLQWVGAVRTGTIIFILTAEEVFQCLAAQQCWCAWQCWCACQSCTQPLPLHLICSRLFSWRRIELEENLNLVKLLVENVEIIIWF